MKRIVSFFMMAAIIFGLAVVPANAEEVEDIPEGYKKYGELGDEIYYDELGLLAYLVYAEAGNQDLTGKKLVADIVLNRMEDPRFPDTISEVIYQKNQFYPRGSRRLEWAAKHVTNECYQAVSEEIDGERTDPNIFFYCANYYQPYGRPAYKYGDHYFNYF